MYLDCDIFLLTKTQNKIIKMDEIDMSESFVQDD